jgi:hypothetical protein
MEDGYFELMEKVCEILGHRDRSETSLKLLHSYFMKENQFMRRIAEEKGLNELFRIY